MARIDHTFGRLVLNNRCPLPEWYKNHLFETKKGWKGTPHLLWTGWINEYGFPSHKVNGRVYPLNGHLLFKCHNFSVAGDEMAITVCGVLPCVQTSHMVITQRKRKGELVPEIT